MINPTEHIADQFGRIHDYLRISLTERCNLRCFYCMPEDGIVLSEKSNLMSHEEVIAIAQQFVQLGVKKIRLTGGEPLLKKNIEKIIEELSQFPISLGITTNGILLEKYIDLFKKCGVKDINVSLDTLNKEKFEQITRRDYFDKVLSNIDLYEENGFNVKINNVIIKGTNDDEIADFIAFTKDRNIAIRFIEFMPFDGNKWNTEKIITLDDILKVAKERFSEENIITLKSKKNGTAKNFRINGFKGEFGVISTVSNPFCDSCNRIRLTANGRIKNCLFSSTETDLLTPLRNGENIAEHIKKGILHKFKVRGGMETNEDFFNEDNFTKNRNMTTIGG
ncbi:MAG: GTP 3',8-cyclase MoaA [Flavobacteriales bacterium]|nr:GTP 3',8-cyclase MoaA [Flavobacteriales bacterium]